MGSWGSGSIVARSSSSSSNGNGSAATALESELSQDMASDCGC